MIWLRALIALVALCAGAGAAQAGCTVSSPTMRFANGSTYDVRAGSVASINGPAGLACTGSVLSVLGTGYARATMTSANGFLLKGPGGSTIPFAVAADSNGTFGFTQGGTINYFNPTLLSLANILFPNSFSPALYARVTASPNIPPGVYSDTLTVQWSWKVCTGLDVLGLVCVGYETSTGTSTIPISLTVGADCRISAPNISFGSAALVSQFTAVNQAVLIDCSLGATYKVAFSGGSAGSARPWRTMSDGAGHVLQYNIYRADGATIWDETNPLFSSVAGTGATTPAQIQNYVAKINPSQPTPPAGAYADIVSVVISF